MNDDNTRLCARCLRTMTEGRGEFFEVRIEAIADPTPPILDGHQELDVASVRSEYEELVGALRDTSAREAQDQVHRQVMISLCNRCFVDWIEDPAKRSE